ncbi:MAG: bifunctional aspartate transaminase/aspartate 4-decarboxylase [Candidatus Eremiobacteraeota bacterium]|nr:bifunctional aspartate transaminase/aspartate 4-decarboxylase [Candidatus Eremiobacteraeota bacterium]
MKSAEEKLYESLSPFELKNKLIDLAEDHTERLMLNAGRGNPNWVATTPREAFFQLGLFAVEETKRAFDLPGLGGSPEGKGAALRFEEFLKRNPAAPGISFLGQAYEYACREIKLNADDFIGEMVDAIMGDHYPTPDRMLRNTTGIVRKYLDQELFNGNPPPGKFELFAVEGGTAAMAYIFNSLVENRLLHRGDRIAIGTPIFTPYIEIPRLNDYDFVELEVKQDENLTWQFPDEEIEKLEDPSVKAFFLINPSNPASVRVSESTLQKIAGLVTTKRKDLIILTDDVYATFVNGFRSLASAAPHNTILVYSYSKYFGATGWRLGVIALHEENVLDRKIALLPEEDRKALHARYEHVELDPDAMKMIERMVADSRSVALHHTAGLSTPQQVMMALFSLFCLVDGKGEYKKATQGIVKKRFRTLYDAVGIAVPDNEYMARYYATIDVPAIAKARYGDEFARFLVERNEPIDFVVRLAEEKSIVLMDGGGFDAPRMSVRVSLANLPDEAYEKIGRGISDLLADYHRRWESDRH